MLLSALLKATPALFIIRTSNQGIRRVGGIYKLIPVKFILNFLL